jgi:hypothetical protein
MWSMSWHDVDMVYLFQRPDTMARAWQKACAEMAPGSWFVSLEFEVPDVSAAAVWQQPGQRAVHVYRMGAADRPVPAQLRPHAADKAPNLRPPTGGQLTGIH